MNKVRLKYIRRTFKGIKTKGLNITTYLTMSMKNLNITFEDKEFKHLLKVKADKDWRRFFLDITGYNVYSPKESVGEGGGS